VNSNIEIYNGRRTHVQRTALQVAGLRCSEWFSRTRLFTELL